MRVGPFHDRFATVYFAGMTKKDCLTGGCGWCILDEHNNQVTQGSCYLAQHFPSQIRLEFEALLNVLKTATTNGFSRILIAGTSAIVISHVIGSPTFSNFLKVFKSIDAEIVDLTTSLTMALRGFREVRTELITEAENAHSLKQAEKALLAYLKKRKKEINRIVFTDYGVRKAGVKDGSNDGWDESNN